MWQTNGPMKALGHLATQFRSRLAAASFLVVGLAMPVVGNAQPPAIKGSGDAAAPVVYANESPAKSLTAPHEAAPEAAPKPPAPGVDSADRTLASSDVEHASTKFAVTTAREAEGSPRPGRESGIVERPKEPRNLLWVPRALLFVPKTALEVAMAPIRGGGWAYEHYAVGERFTRIVFDEKEEVGLFPVVSYESGFGPNWGVKGVHRNLFGKRERVSMEANFGGRFRQSYALRAGSGNRFKRLSPGLRVGYERRPKDIYYGIGNDARAERSGEGLDPLLDDGAVKSRYRQDIARATLEMDLKLRRELSLHLRSSLQGRAFARSLEDQATQDIEANFDTRALVGFEDGLRNAYNEAELRLDTRKALSPFESSATPGAGWFIAGFTGYARGIQSDPSNYLRYGLHVQRYIRLARGPRTLALRAYVEGVTGDYNDVPFVDLPRLGGSLLRGYNRGRFQDRVATVATAEYRWDLSERMASIVYVDAGRVHPSLSELSFDSFRASAGGALQLHSKTSFSMRLGFGVSVGRNREPGAVVRLSLQPAFETQERTVRR